MFCPVLNLSYFLTFIGLTDTEIKTLWFFFLVLWLEVCYINKKVQLKFFFYGLELFERTTGVCINMYYIVSFNKETIVVFFSEFLIKSFLSENYLNNLKLKMWMKVIDF